MVLNHLEQLPNGAKVCLYGAGSGGRYLARVLKTKRSDVEICAFLDDTKRGELEGIAILEPKVAVRKFDDALFIVSSGYISELSQNLKSLGVNDFLVANPIFFDGELIGMDEWLAKIPDWCVPHHGKMRDKKDLEGADRAELLLEQKDRELYRFLIENRISPSDSFAKDIYQNFKHIFTPYLDFINKSAIETIIEGGVLDGYNSMQFLTLGESVKIYGFEPYIDVYKKSQYREFLDASGARVFDMALWSRDGEVSFCEDLSAPASKVSEHGGKVVKSVKLESFVLDEKLESFDFLKLDVEGVGDGDSKRRDGSNKEI